MDGPRDNHVKWGKSEKDKYHIIHLCTEPKKKNDSNKPYFQNRNRLTDIENKFMITKGESAGTAGAGIRSFGLTCKHYYI